MVALSAAQLQAALLEGQGDGRVDKQQGARVSWDARSFPSTAGLRVRSALHHAVAAGGARCDSNPPTPAPTLTISAGLSTKDSKMPAVPAERGTATASGSCRPGPCSKHAA